MTTLSGAEFDMERVCGLVDPIRNGGRGTWVKAHRFLNDSTKRPNGEMLWPVPDQLCRSSVCFVGISIGDDIVISQLLVFRL